MHKNSKKNAKTLLSKRVSPKVFLKMSLSLFHVVREPKIKLAKNPLLLLLHGYGSNEEDLFSFTSELPEEYYIVSARAPYEMMHSSYAWYAINFDADENKFSDLKIGDYIVVYFDIDKKDFSLPIQEIKKVIFDLSLEATVEKVEDIMIIMDI